MPREDWFAFSVDALLSHGVPLLAVRYAITIITEAVIPSY